MSRLYRYSIALVAALLMLAPLEASAQSAEDGLRLSDREPAVGVRMSAMSGAGGFAGAADFGALFANPAGLGFLDGSYVSGSLTNLVTSEDVRFVTPDFSSGSDESISNMRIGHLAYLYKVPTAQGSLVVGASYQRTNPFNRSFSFAGENYTNSVTDFFLPFSSEYEIQYDDDGNFAGLDFFRDLSWLAYEGGAIEFYPECLDLECPLFDTAVAPGSRIDQRGEVIEEGGMNEVSFGGAFEAAENLMVGVSANMLFGSYRFESTFDEIDSYGDNADYIVFVGGDELVGLDDIRYVQGYEADIVGFNARLGVSGSLTPGLRAGLSIETPTYQHISEYYWEDIATRFLVGGELAEGYDGDFEYRITTPWRIGGGIAYQTPRLTVAADAEYVDWSQMRFSSTTERGYFEDLNREIRRSYDPVLNTRVGAEFWVGDLALRGGYAYKPDPRQDDLVLTSGTTNRAQTFVSAGLGYRFNNQFMVDFAWTQQRFNDAYVPYAVDNAPIVEEEVTRNRFSVGFSVRL